MRHSKKLSLAGAATTIIFVATNTCLTRQNTSFFATKVCLSRQTRVCCEKYLSWHNFVTTKVFSLQAYYNKTFVTTKMTLQAAPMNDKKTLLCLVFIPFLLTAPMLLLCFGFPFSLNNSAERKNKMKHTASCQKLHHVRQLCINV